MKALFVRDRLFEFERTFDSPDNFKDALKIGDVRARAVNILKTFAEENGYGFEVRKNGNVVIDADGKRFSITFPVERADTEEPISLRNSSGQLMDRFRNGSEVVKRIQGNLKRDAKARTRTVKPGETLLTAISNEDEAKVRMLLKFGVSPNHSVNTRIGNNIPLIVAINSGNMEIIKILVEAGADVNVVGKNGETPLMIAMGSAYRITRAFRIFKYLIDHGSNPFTYSNLYWSLGNSSVEFLQHLLDKFTPEDFDKQELIDLLTTSVWMGQSKKVKALLDYGVDPYKKSSVGANRNSFKTYDATEGYMRSQKRDGDYYRYDDVKRLLDEYR